MNAPLEIGLIGCGRVAERCYVPALSGSQEVRLVAVADPVRERAELVASSAPGCRIFDSAEKLVNDGDVSAAIVTTPTATHVPVATLALHRGLPVLVEKPLATSAEHLEELEALAAASNAPLAMGFNRRCWEPVRRLRAILAREGGAADASAELHLATDISRWSPVESVADPLDDLGSHQLDLVRFLFGERIAFLRARWVDTRTIRMQVAISGGGVAEAVSAHGDREAESVAVRCRAGRYEAHMGSEHTWPASGVLRTGLDWGDALGRRVLGRRSSLRLSFDRQLRGFVECVRTGRSPCAGLADGIAAVRAVEAARRSVSSDGAEVEVEP